MVSCNLLLAMISLVVIRELMNARLNYDLLHIFGNSCLWHVFGVNWINEKS